MLTSVGSTLILFAVATAQAQPAQPSSQPAQPSALEAGTPRDLRGDFTTIIELAEGNLNVSENWNLRNRSGKQIPAAGLELPLPRGASLARVDENTPGFAAREDFRGVKATSPMGPGDRGVGVQYRLEVSGSRATLSREIPFDLDGARLIAEDVQGITVSASVEPTRRPRELNGINFVIWEFPPMRAGTRLDIEVRGLPSKATWPRGLALAASALILAWMLVTLVKGQPAGAARKAKALGALSASARKERLVRAMEILEEDRKAEKIADKAYARRRSALMAELAKTLREAELERTG